MNHLLPTFFTAVVTAVGVTAASAAVPDQPVRLSYRVVDVEAGLPAAVVEVLERKAGIKQETADELGGGKSLETQWEIVLFNDAIRFEREVIGVNGDPPAIDNLPPTAVSQVLVIQDDGLRESLFVTRGHQTGEMGRGDAAITSANLRFPHDSYLDVVLGLRGFDGNAIVEREELLSVEAPEGHVLEGVVDERGRLHIWTRRGDREGPVVKYEMWQSRQSVGEGLPTVEAEVTDHVEIAEMHIPAEVTWIHRAAFGRHVIERRAQISVTECELLDEGNGAIRRVEWPVGTIVNLLSQRRGHRIERDGETLD